MANIAATIITVAALGIIGPPAQARAPLTRLKIAADRSLPKDLVWWFTAPSAAPSARHPLPAAGADGVISIDVPARYDVPGGQIRVLDPAKKVLAHLPIRESNGRLAGTLRSPNLLQNPNFQGETDHWIPELNGGTAKGQLEWLGSNEMPKGVPGKALRVRVLAIDPVAWHVQVHQLGLDLADSEPYTLTFWARADRARSLSVNATVDKEDFHWIGLINQVPLTTEWRKFVLAFTATRTLPNHNRIGFVMGDAVGVVDLAGLSLQRGVSAGPAAENLIRNGSFARGAESWSTSVVDPAKAQSKVPSDLLGPPAAQGKVAHLEVAGTGPQSWYVQFYQTGIDLTEGETLTLSFWGRSARSRPVSMIVGEDKEDYHTVGLDNTARLTPSWQKFNFVFTATRTVRNSHRLTFLMGDMPGDVDLADVELRPGAEALADPSGGIESDLRAADFRYSEAVTVPVKFHGKPVQDLAVTLKTGDETIASKKLRAADRGAGRFSDVPIDEKITVIVSDGRQTAEFPRIVASDAPDVIADIDVPDNWTDIQTLADAAGAPLPFVGAWESRTGPGASRYITTFNADGTGTIKRVTEDPLSGAALKTFASGAFLWHAKESDHTIAMSSKEYTWSIVGKGRDAKLILKDSKGKNHTLYRR